MLGEKYKPMRGLAKQVFAEAAAHVRSVFGYKLVKAPKKHFPQAKFKDGFYLVNDLPLGKKKRRNARFDARARSPPFKAPHAFFL